MVFTVLLDFSFSVKAAPHECVFRTGQPLTEVKAENEARFYSIILRHYLNIDAKYII